MPRKGCRGIDVNDHEVLIAQDRFVSQFYPVDGAEIERSLRWSTFGQGANPDTRLSQSDVAAGPAGILVLSCWSAA